MPLPTTVMIGEYYQTKIITFHLQMVKFMIIWNHSEDLISRWQGVYQVMTQQFHASLTRF